MTYVYTSWFDAISVPTTPFSCPRVYPGTGVQYSVYIYHFMFRGIAIKEITMKLPVVQCKEVSGST